MLKKIPKYKPELFNKMIDTIYSSLIFNTVKCHLTLYNFYKNPKGIYADIKIDNTTTGRIENITKERVKALYKNSYDKDKTKENKKRVQFDNVIYKFGNKSSIHVSSRWITIEIADYTDYKDIISVINLIIHEKINNCEIYILANY